MRRLALWISLLAALPAAARAADCEPCAGLSVADPEPVALQLATGPALDEESVLWVRWTPPAGSAPQAAEAAAALRAAGATPWLAVELSTPAPLLDNAAALGDELRGLAELAAAVGGGAVFQLAWSGGGTPPQPDEYAFLIKRAAVAVTGAAPGATVVGGALEPDPAYLGRLYGHGVAAYLDGIALTPDRPLALEAAAAALLELDPGAGLFVDGAPRPEAAADILAEAARHAAAGMSGTLFDLGALPEDSGAELLAPFRLLAREFHGDLSLDPYSAPEGAAEAWSFVRGEDLALRVIVRTEPGSERVELELPDAGLRDPALFDLDTAEPVPLYGLRTGSGFELEVEPPASTMVLAFERMTASEREGMEGLEETVVVEDTRQMPVEEILSRLQAFEDSQWRRLRNYHSINTSHLRFEVGTGAGSVEATFRGDFFYRQGEPFDWAWREFYINGVRWRNRSIPEIPLIQPEKATALPVEITFDKTYDYRLRGTETVAGRDCWVIDFEPAVEDVEEARLHQGTVWVDRQIWARVRTRTVQLGLTGDVLSNEETTTWEPLDADGEPAPWSPTSYYLPTRVVGQQIWSVLSATTVVERELVLSEVEINVPDIEARRRELLDSELTMVRDTPRGLRYLELDEETGERVVQEELDTSRRFLVGGVFHDESLDFPVPLAGMNWLWFDWRDTGTQVNVFFAGALFNVAVTDPDFLGSRFDAGFDVFGLALAGSDVRFRDGVEVRGEEVEVLSPSIDLKIGRPIGSFFKLDLRYELEWNKYSSGDDTAEEFVLPSDHFNHGLTLAGRYNRGGYRVLLSGNYNLRDEWEPWGIPGSGEFEPDDDTYWRWRASVGKTWHLPKFTKFGAELEYVDGERLDRFSKYEFGFFSDVRVHGYQSDKVRAEEALATHLRYGFDVGELFRLDLVGDAVWATDEESGLEEELLSGVGLVGTVVGPWSTVINLDLGVALSGPDDGISVFLAVLKLFDG